MEKKVLDFVRTNRITVTIGGEQRTIVMGMRTMERVAKALQDKKPEAITSVDGFATTVIEGMRNKPDGLKLDTVVEWIDDMEKSEQVTLTAFVYEQLGFMMKEYLDGIGELTKTLNEEADREEANLNQTQQ
jgi:thioester reductase-like protein